MAFSPVYAAIVSKTVRMESSLSSRWAYDGGSLGAWAVLGVSSRGMALGIVPLAMRLPLHMLWWVQLIMLAAVARETAVEMCQAPIAAAPAVVGLLGTIHSAMDATAALLPFPWMSRAAWAFEPEAPWATFVAVSLFSQCLCAALPVASALLTDANVVRKAKRSRPTTTRSSMSQASGSARRRSSLSRTAVSSFDSTVVAWVAEHLDTVELFPMQVGLMASAVLGMLWVLLRWTAWRLCPAATSAAQYASL